MSKVIADLQDLKNAFISHCKELGCEENYIKACENKFDNIETTLKDNETNKSLMEQYGIKNISMLESAFISFVSDFDEDGRNHLMDELNALDIIKDKLDFHFDNQKQTVNIRLNHRLVPGKGLTICFEKPEEFNSLKEVFKHE